MAGAAPGSRGEKTYEFSCREAAEDVAAVLGGSPVRVLP
jgi:hypothetical protein